MNRENTTRIPTTWLKSPPPHPLPVSVLSGATFCKLISGGCACRGTVHAAEAVMVDVTLLL
jgi:hypothetical protein